MQSNVLTNSNRKQSPYLSTNPESNEGKPNTASPSTDQIRRHSRAEDLGAIKPNQTNSTKSSISQLSNTNNKRFPMNNNSTRDRSLLFGKPAAPNNTYSTPSTKQSFTNFR